MLWSKDTEISAAVPPDYIDSLLKLHPSNSILNTTIKYDKTTFFNL